MAAAWTGCQHPACGQPHPKGCHGHVDECPNCLVRHDNRPGVPCVECGTIVILRPCKLPPMAGLEVCYRHGGAAPQTRKAGRRRVAEDKALAAVERRLADTPVVPVTNPISMLASSAGRAKALEDFLYETVAEMRGADWRYQAEHGEQLNALVALLERALDRCRQFGTDMARVGLEAMQIQVEDRQAELVERAAVLALTDAGIVADQAVMFRQAFARRLRGGDDDVRRLTS